MFKGKQRDDLALITTAAPGLPLAQQREQQRAEQTLIQMIAAQPHAVDGLHLEAFVLSAQHAQIQRATTEIHRQQAARLRAGEGVHVAQRRRHGLRVEHLAREAGVMRRFRQTLQRHRIVLRLAPFEIHRMPQAGMIAGPERGAVPPSPVQQALPHGQQQRRDQGHGTEGFLEHHQTAQPGIAQQALDPAKQPTFLAGIDEGLAEHLLTARQCGQPLFVQLPRARARLAQHLGRQLHPAAAIVRNVTIDGGLAGTHLELPVDVRGRGRGDRIRFQRHADEALAIEHGQHAVAGAIVQPDARPARGGRTGNTRRLLHGVLLCAIAGESAKGSFIAQGLQPGDPPSGGPGVLRTLQNQCSAPFRKPC